jgi:pimeloyl-ACP methyl ester carboxylesterase
MATAEKSWVPDGRGDPRQRLVRAMPVTERVFDLGGISTAVLEGGAGAPIVLLHGPAACAAHWMRVIHGLVGTHRVIAPDLPGHGASVVIDGALPASRVLEWLGSVIERTCAAPPTLVGHLVGGAIAARFAIERGDLLGRLVLVDTFGLDELRLPPEFAAALSQYLARPSEATHERLWRHCAFDLDGLRRQMGALWEPFAAYDVDRMRTPGVASAVSALMEQFGDPAIPATSLARIALPTTLICGRHDRATLPAAEAASRRLGWPLHVIDGAADDPPVEQPEELVGTLLRAFSSIPETAAAARTGR